MSKKIQIKRGLKVGIPTLDSGELGYATDTKELFIGTAGGNELATPFVNEYSLTISTGDWSQETTGNFVDNYKAVKTLTGLASTKNPTVDLDLTGKDKFSIDGYISDFEKVVGWEVTSNNEITFYAVEQPTQDLLLHIKVVK